MCALAGSITHIVHGSLLQPCPSRDYALWVLLRPAGCPLVCKRAGCLPSPPSANPACPKCLRLFSSIHTHPLVILQPQDLSGPRGYQVGSPAPRTPRTRPRLSPPNAFPPKSVPTLPILGLLGTKHLSLTACLIKHIIYSFQDKRYAFRLLLCLHTHP